MRPGVLIVMIAVLCSACGAPGSQPTAGEDPAAHQAHEAYVTAGRWTLAGATNFNSQALPPVVTSGPRGQAPLVVKWDLDNRVPMKGAASRRILALIAELEAEGVL